jgi:enamine deaminase RidA (YjgF/YER057c/UK114 family)
MTTIQPPGWVPPKGYANGLVAEGKFLFISGTVGWDPRSEEPRFAASFVGQFDQALSNICEVVQAAGGLPEHVARMTIYVIDKREYVGALREVGQAWRKHFGRHFPAMALVQVAALVEDQAKLEIETTCVLPKA